MNIFADSKILGFSEISHQGMSILHLKESILENLKSDLIAFALSYLEKRSSRLKNSFVIIAFVI